MLVTLQRCRVAHTLRTSRFDMPATARTNLVVLRLRRRVTVMVLPFLFRRRQAWVQVSCPGFFFWRYKDMHLEFSRIMVCEPTMAPRHRDEVSRGTLGEARIVPHVKRPRPYLPITAHELAAMAGVDAQLAERANVGPGGVHSHTTRQPCERAAHGSRVAEQGLSHAQLARSGHIVAAGTTTMAVRTHLTTMVTNDVPQRRWVGYLSSCDGEGWRAACVWPLWCGLPNARSPLF